MTGLTAKGAATRERIVRAAADLVLDRGVGGMTLDEIRAGTATSKSQLFHYFPGGKSELVAAIAALQSGRVLAAQQPWIDDLGTLESWQGWRDAVVAYYRDLTHKYGDPTYQRIVIQEGPAILGYERFREHEERSSYGIVQDIVGSVLEASTYELDEAMTQTFSRIFFGAMSAAGESVSSAPDPKAAVARIEAAIGFILEGLRGLAEQGITLTDPASEPAGADELPEGS